MSARLRSVRPGTRWIVAAFDDPEKLVALVRGVDAAGFTRWEAFTPFEVEDIEEMLFDRRRSPVSLAMGIGGALAAAGAFFMLEFSTHVYPLNVGGRPLNSWPAFIPITFELTVLGASFGGLGAFLYLAGLPRLHHPMFEVDGFERASQDRFFLAIEAKDDSAEPQSIRELVRRSEPLATQELTP